MASLNKVQLIGHLGADPEMRYLPSGDAVANLRVATTDAWKDKDGNKQEATEWHRVSFFSRQAEICGQYLKKGAQVYIEGSIRTRKYTDKDGVEKYSTEIRGERMQMLGSRPEGQRQPSGGGTASDYNSRANDGVAPSKPAQQPAGGGFNDFEDDPLPF